MLPRMSSTLGFQVPQRQPNADEPNLVATSSTFCSGRTIAQLHYISHMAGKMLMHIK